MNEDLWQGIRPEARKSLAVKNYTPASLLEQLSTTGVEAAKLLTLDRNEPSVRASWIPGVEIFPRTVFPQRQRGNFSEFGRQGEGIFGQIQFWPQQWATARMYAGTAKGFHIHPPHLEPGEDAAAWFQQLFAPGPPNFSLRRYNQEQWDAMFIVQGKVDFLLVDERIGMPRRVMRFFMEGDASSKNQTGLIIPPGVAHALRVEGSEDLLMVYGTSISFDPRNEGRIASGIESAPLPPDWQAYLDSAEK